MLGVTLSTTAFCIPGTENLHLVFSYSVWVLRDFPEDGLKVNVVETSTLPLKFLVGHMEFGEVSVKSHLLMLNPIKYIICFFCVWYCAKISGR